MKTNQRVALTKRLLQEALLRLLKTKPIDRIYVTELCEESGINRATFYRHYFTPKDVLLELQKEFVGEVQANYQVTDILQNPERCLEELCVHLYAHADLIKLLMENLSEKDLLYYCTEIFVDLLKENAKKGEKSEDIQLWASYFAGGMYFLLRRWLLEDGGKSPQEMAQFLKTLLQSLF